MKKPKGLRAIGLTERFMAKVSPEPNSGCWLWTASITQCHMGYGKFRESTSKMELAHREAWKLFKGSIPAGFFVLHKCDTPTCVNPDHLFLGTHEDNMRDGVQKKRFLSNAGEQCGTARLTWDQVRIIRSSKDTQTVLAQRFNIAQTTVSQIQTMKSWRE